MSLKVAVIPARAGSKRLPGKNIKEIAGKPLIAWTIEAALNSKMFDKIIVSTDCLNIKDVAIHYGAEVPFLRDEKLASDTATTSDVVVEVVSWLENNIGQVEEVTLLQPTSPLRTAAHIIQACKLKKEKKANAIVSVCKLEHPLELCNTLAKDHSMKSFISPESYKRSQELKEYYRLNGAIYIIDRQLINDFNNLYGDHSFAYVMKPEVSIDVDEFYDFEIAEYLLGKLIF